MVLDYQGRIRTSRLRAPQGLVHGTSPALDIMIRFDAQAGVSGWPWQVEAAQHFTFVLTASHLFTDDDSPVHKYTGILYIHIQVSKA